MQGLEIHLQNLQKINFLQIIIAHAQTHHLYDSLNNNYIIDLCITHIIIRSINRDVLNAI